MLFYIEGKCFSERTPAIYLTHLAFISYCLVVSPELAMKRTSEALACALTLLFYFQLKWFNTVGLIALIR